MGSDKTGPLPKLLHSLLDKLVSNIDNAKFNIPVLLDFNKAFDTTYCHLLRSNIKNAQTGQKDRSYVVYVSGTMIDWQFLYAVSAA